jgi:hypothetical protein
MGSSEFQTQMITDKNILQVLFFPLYFYGSSKICFKGKLFLSVYSYFIQQVGVLECTI